MTMKDCGYKYARSDWRLFVSGYVDGEKPVEMSRGKDEAWAKLTYIRDLSSLKQQVYTCASEEMARLGKVKTCDHVQVEIIDLHFPKGRRDIKVAGFIVRRHIKDCDRMITERYEIAVRHLGENE